jgi:hypothetical protein
VLPVVDDRHGGLGGIGGSLQTDIACNAHALPRHRVDRGQRLVLVMVDLAEESELLIREPLLQSQKPPVPGLLAEALEAGCKERLVLGTDRPDRHRRAVTEAECLHATALPESLAQMRDRTYLRRR